MSRFCSDNNNFPYDNNALVLDMVLGSLWGVPQPINWDNVAKLVPGFTGKECSRRFEELRSSGTFPRVDDQCNALTGGSGSPADGSTPDARELAETAHEEVTGKPLESPLTSSLMLVAQTKPAGSVCAAESKDKKLSPKESEKPQKPKE
ncbi:SANT and BTB domain regulator of class switch recombination-like [Neosynchiropus ocellatus]